MMKKKPKWKLLHRASGLVEWICEHGVGHPDEDSAELIAKHYGHSTDTWLVHGCDGCCSKKDFPGRKLGVKEKRNFIKNMEG